MNGQRTNSDVRVYYCRNCVRGREAVSALQRLDLREDVILEAVPCSGRIDPRYLLKAFESGARAVCVLACASGHCRLMEGNLRATRRTMAVRNLLSEAGLDSDCVQIFLPDSPEESALRKAVEGISRFVGDEMKVATEVMA